MIFQIKMKNEKQTLFQISMFSYFEKLYVLCFNFSTETKINDVILLLDEVYLQKDTKYQDGKLVGADNEGNCTKVL